MIRPQLCSTLIGSRCLKTRSKFAATGPCAVLRPPSPTTRDLLTMSSHISKQNSCNNSSNYPFIYDVNSKGNMAERESQKLKSPSYGDTVVESFQRLRQEDELCDFTVSAQGRHFKVHKCLLAATSDYFKAMYKDHMRESKECAVDLKGLMTASALEQIIDFIYSGNMTLHLDNLSDILYAVSHLQISSAIDLCSDYMISLLTFSSSEEVLKIADTYSLTKVINHYSKMILNQFEEFSHTDQFLSLTMDQLITYISSDKLKVRSEFALFDCVKRWLEHYKSTYLSQIDKLLCHVRFALMSELELQMLQAAPLTRLCPSLNTYIREALKFHHDCQNGHPVVNKQCEIRATESSLALVHQGSSFRPFEVIALDGSNLKFYQLINDVNGSRDSRVAVFENFVYIARVVDFGGGTLMNSLCRFDMRHMRLQELQPFRRLRIDPAFVCFGRQLYLFGGCNEHLCSLDSVECYDIHTNTWTEPNPLPAPTQSLAAVSHEECIYLSGGVSGLERHPTRTFTCFHPSSGRWETKPEMHCDRRLHAMDVIGQRLFVVGGISRHGIHAQSQVPSECYDLKTNQWTLLSSTLSGRSVGHFIAFQGKILSVGREHKNATEDEIWVYDVESDTWSTYAKVMHRMGLASASCCLLQINFQDERVAKTVMKEKR